MISCLPRALVPFALCVLGVSAVACTPCHRGTDRTDPFATVVEFCHDDRDKLKRVTLFLWVPGDLCVDGRPKEMTVTSEDPEILDWIRGGLSRALRRVEVHDAGTAAWLYGGLLVETRKREFAIHICGAGFWTGRTSSEDSNTFYCRALALAVDALYHGKTGKHLPFHLFRALSYPSWIASLIDPAKEPLPDNGYLWQ